MVQIPFQFVRYFRLFDTTVHPNNFGVGLLYSPVNINSKFMYSSLHWWIFWTLIDLGFMSFLVSRWKRPKFFSLSNIRIFSSPLLRCGRTVDVWGFLFLIRNVSMMKRVHKQVPKHWNEYKIVPRRKTKNTLISLCSRYFIYGRLEDTGLRNAVLY